MKATGLLSRIITTFLALACAFAAQADPSAAIGFDPPGSVYTRPLAISPAGVIAGYYYVSFDPSQVARGFVRAADGVITTFEFPGGSGCYTYASGFQACYVMMSMNPEGVITGSYSNTAAPDNSFVRDQNGVVTMFAAQPGTGYQVLGINPAGLITGTYDDANGVSHGFVRAPTGAITTFDPMGSIYTIPTAINPAGVVMGAYESGNVLHGFLRAPTGTITTFDPPDSEGISCLCVINAGGTVAGTYTDATLIEPHGFLRAPNGALASFEFPGGAANTLDAGVVGISQDGSVTGFFYDLSFVPHSFVRTPNGVVITFDPAGSEETVPAAMNPAGEITGYYFDANSHGHGFVRSPNGTFRTFDPAGSVFTGPVAINPEGAVTGSYCDTLACHGFVFGGEDD